MERRREARRGRPLDLNAAIVVSHALASDARGARRAPQVLGAGLIARLDRKEAQRHLPRAAFSVAVGLTWSSAGLPNAPPPPPRLVRQLQPPDAPLPAAALPPRIL